ncbi:tRNA pseudouridine(13) synthase TruD [Thermovibrio ammonificans]
MRVKSSPEAFKVEEVLKEPPGKSGPFRLYRLTKRGVEGLEALKTVAKRSGVPLSVISYGGIKDKNALTVQFLTVPKRFRLKTFKTEGLSLQEAGFARLPAKQLHAGNRFQIAVEEVKEPQEWRLELLKEWGIPNYYGEQRFNSVRGGKCLLHYRPGTIEALLHLFKGAGFESSRERKGKRAFERGDFKTAAELLRGWRREVAKALLKGATFEEAWRLIPREELEFQANLLQSWLFNEKLSGEVKRRCEQPLKLKYRGGTLLYPKEMIELPRTLEAFTLQSAELYSRELEKLRIDPDNLKGYEGLFHSFRRESVVKPKEFKLERLENGFELSFLLPPGAYATNVLRFLFSAV